MSTLGELAETVVAAGIRLGFGITGSGSTLELITELEDRGVRYFPASHEAAAAIMAGTAFQLDGKGAVALSIKGPGLANMLPGIAHNHFENNFALTISEAFGANVPTSRQHKRLDHPALLSSLVKARLDLGAVGEPLRAALVAAREEVPGPVHLDLCQYGEPPHPPAATRAPIAVSWTRLESARRPVVVAGGLARRQGLGRLLGELRVPVFTTVAAKGVIDEAGPYAAGIFTGDGKELAPELPIIAAADLVVGLGLRNTEVLAARRLAAPTLLIDQVPVDRLGDGFEADQVLAPVDQTTLLRALEILQAREWGADLLEESRARLRQRLLSGPFLPAHCFEVLNRSLADVVLVADTGSFCTIAEHLLRASPARPFLASANGRYMGTSVPMAIGAAVAGEGRPVVCFVGDGGVRMYPAELRLAVQERLPVCFVLMRDGRYGSVACVPQKRAMSARALTMAGTSWWPTAAAMGMPAGEVLTEEAFATALNGWDRRSPMFIEAGYDPEAYGPMTAPVR
jgi:acetolactate synthase-1/2/3 large subunit